MRSISTPAAMGTRRPGSVAKISMMLTSTVEPVCARMNHVTLAKFIPEPNSDIIMPAKK